MILSITRATAAGLLACFIAAPALAERGHGGHHGKKERPTVDQKLEKLTEKLALTEEQQTAIRPLLEGPRAQMEPLREEMRALREKMHALRDQNREKVDALLTEEQRAKHESMREERRAKKKGHHGGETCKHHD